jgi:hypothetical protein
VILTFRRALICALHCLLIAGCNHNSPRQVEWTGSVRSSPVQVSYSGIVSLTWMESGRSTTAIIDTGSTGMIVSPEYAHDRHLSITNDPFGLIADAAGKRHGLRMAHLDRFELPGVTLRDFDAVVLDLSALGRATGTHLDIILGRAVFDQMTLTIDYPAQRINLDAQPLPPPDGKTILPIKLNDREEWMVPVTFDNKEFWLILDTAWSGYDLAISHKLREELNVGPASTEPFHSITPLGGQIVQQSAVLNTVPLFVQILPNEGSNLLAAGFLRHFVLSIDSHDQRLRLVSPPDSH